MQRQAALGQNGASANAKVLATIAAAVGHGLHALHGGNIKATAVGANDLAVPAFAFKILTGSFLVREALEELIQADGFGLVGHET